MIERRKKQRKSWAKSLTLWVNSMSGVFIAVMIAVQENFAMLRDLFTPQVYQVIMFLLILVNIALRFRTTQPVGKKDDTQ